MDPTAFAEQVVARPGDTLVAVDFDGTLAEIVDDPASARPVDGAREVLARLAAQLGEVAVVSGRPLGFLVERLGDLASVTLVGLYGLETRRGGRVVEHAGMDRCRAAVRAAVADLDALLPRGAEVEDKGASLTVHYRRDPRSADAVVAAAQRVAATTGLELRHAKMSVELHPDVHVDKGTVLSELADGGSGPVCFLGDDVGDLAAFDALDALAVGGRPTLRVVVSGPETPSALSERADEVVPGPAGAIELLARFES